MAGQLSPATVELIDSLCRDVDRWAPGAGSRPSLVRLLSGGFSNTAALIASDSGQWVVRIRCRDSAAPASGPAEIRLQRVAAAAGLAPPLLYHDRERGVMIMPYLDGHHDAPCDLPRLARLLRGIHALPGIGEQVHAPDLLDRYRKLLPAGHDLTRVLERHASVLAAAVIAAADTGDSPPVLCHNDLLIANRLVCGERLFALDWEYAAPGDPLFDLAVCASEMPPADARRLLGLYLQRPATARETDRFAALQLLYKAIEACWHMQRDGQSPIARRAQARLLATLQDCSLAVTDR